MRNDVNKKFFSVQDIVSAYVDISEGKFRSTATRDVIEHITSRLSSPGDRVAEVQMQKAMETGNSRLIEKAFDKSNIQSTFKKIVEDKLARDALLEQFPALKNLDLEKLGNAKNAKDSFKQTVFVMGAIGKEAEVSSLPKGEFPDIYRTTSGSPYYSELQKARESYKASQVYFPREHADKLKNEVAAFEASKAASDVGSTVKVAQAAELSFLDKAGAVLKQGAKWLGKHAPIIGGVVTAGFVAAEVAEDAMNGEFKRAGGALAAGVPEAVINTTGAGMFGAGDAAREAVRETIRQTAGEEATPEKSGLRALGETVYGAVAENQTDVVKDGAIKGAEKISLTESFSAGVPAEDRNMPKDGAQKPAPATVLKQDMNI